MILPACCSVDLHVHILFMDLNNDDFSCNKFSIPELKDCLHDRTKPNSLSDVFFANIRSLRKNFSDLIEVLESLDHIFSLIILNETWLEPSEHDLFQIEGYDLFSAPRNRHGGGLLIYVKEDIHAFPLEQFTYTNPIFESLFLKIKFKSKTLTVGTVYRPPSNSHNINDFLDEFKKKVLSALPSSNCIIFGDFNIDTLNNGNQVSNFVTEMSSRGFANLIEHPTRVHLDDNGNAISSTSIDHIWSSCHNVESSFVLNYHLTDHYPIGCSIDLPLPNDKQVKKSRKINKDAITSYQKDFMEFFTKFKIDGDVEPVFENVYTTLKAMTLSHFPIEYELVKTRKIQRPWINKTLKKLIDKKHLIYKKCKLKLLPFSRFKTYRNLLNKTLRLAEKIYYEKKFNELNNSKQTWNLINSLSKPCPKSKKILIKENGIAIEDKKVLSNKFKDEYSYTPPHTNHNVPLDHISMNKNTFFMSPITNQEVYNMLFSMNTNSIFSDLPIKILRYLGEPICVLLTSLFNFAISKNQFPSILKIGYITPIPKKGSLNNIKNYRPITILNSISKIFDAILYKRLYDFFSKNNLFSKYQFGFLRKKGIEQAAMNLIYEINYALQNDETCVAIFIDLTKAFDRVNLDILERILYKYGIRGDTLEFLKSYLTNRCIYTKIDDNQSEPVFSDAFFSNAGVAQGSNLGPLLFNIFINDIHKMIKNCSILVYADDVVISYSSKDHDLIMQSIESDLSNLHEYFTNLGQSINFSKTKGMIFTRRKTAEITVIFDNRPIEFVKEFKYLGLTIDNKLTFHTHIENIKKKVNQGNGKIFYFKKFLPIRILKNIFYSIIYPHLNLHITIWGGSTPTALNPLITAVNKTIRNIYHSGHDTATKYRKLQILTVSQIYNLRLGEFFYKTLKLSQPQLLHDILPEISFHHSYNTRHHQNFRNPPVQINSNKRFFLYKAIEFWRTLPPETQNASSLNVFKNDIKNMYFHNN